MGRDVRYNFLGAPVVGQKTQQRLSRGKNTSRGRKLTERYKNLGKTLHLRHLSDDCKLLLKNAESIIDVNVLKDPHYKVVIDKI